MYRYEGGNTRFCWLNVANWTETMLPPYVIGHTAHDVTTWQCEYIRIIEREEGQSKLPVHWLAGKYTAVL